MLRSLAVLVLAAACIAGPTPAGPANLVKNAHFTEAGPAHYDDARGWHYHVTPGKFPYVIGGYWGEPDPRNMRRAPGGGAGAGGPGRPPGPPAGGGVNVLPPFARDRLTLTADQQKELADLEKEARATLDAILTPEQRKRLEEARPPRKEYRRRLRRCRVRHSPRHAATPQAAG